MAMKIALFRTSDGRPYVLYGVSAELALWARGSTTTLRAFAVAGESGVERPAYATASAMMDDIVLVLGGHDGWQIDAAERVIDAVWRSQPRLGPYPCKGMVARLQANGTFYPGYRDHVAHQVLVFLLGLYFYEQCKPIRDEVIREIAAEGVLANSCASEFLLRWTAAALSHDVGYVLENNVIDPIAGGPEWKDLLEFLDCLRHPLSHALADPDRVGPAVAAEKTLVADHNGQHVTVFPDIESVGALRTYGGQPILAELDAYAGRTNLGLTLAEGASLLGEYDKHTQTHRTHMRGPYRDHGIAGAVLLMGAWKRFQTRLAQIAAWPQAMQRFQNPGIWGELSALHARLSAPTIQAAAAAVAMHNINCWQWYEPDLTAGGLNPFFHMDLTGSHATPLAVLLALADTLQCWSRPHFRATKGPPSIRDQDVTIRCDGGKILLGYRESDRFDKTVQECRAYLGADVVQLLAHDTTEKFQEDCGDFRTPAPIPGTPGMPQEIASKIRDLTGQPPGAVNWEVCRNPLRADQETRICRYQWGALHMTAEMRRSLVAIGETLEVRSLLQELAGLIAFVADGPEGPEAARPAANRVHLLGQPWSRIKDIVTLLDATFIAMERVYPNGLSGTERLGLFLKLRLSPDQDWPMLREFMAAYGEINRMADYYYSAA
jgi:hypothetical protein